MAVNLARFGYSDQAQQNSRDAILQDVRGNSSFFAGERNSNLPKALSATEAGTNASTGFSNDFDFARYGKDQDTLKASNSGGGASEDRDREIGIEQKPQMAMGINLDLNDLLVNEHKVPLEDLAYGRSLGKSDEQMISNLENGLAIDGGKAVESGLPLQVQRQIDSIQDGLQAKSVNYVDTDNREQAANVDNGLEASALGAQQGVVLATTFAR